MKHIPLDAASTWLRVQVVHSFGILKATAPSDSVSDALALYDAWDKHPDAIVDDAIFRLHAATAAISGDHPLRFVWHLWRAHRANRRLEYAWHHRRDIGDAQESYKKHLMAMYDLIPRCERPDHDDSFERGGASDVRRHHGEGKL